MGQLVYLIQGQLTQFFVQNLSQPQKAAEGTAQVVRDDGKEFVFFSVGQDKLFVFKFLFLSLQVYGR